MLEILQPPPAEETHEFPKLVVDLGLLYEDWDYHGYPDSMTLENYEGIIECYLAYHGFGGPGVKEKGKNIAKAVRMITGSSENVQYNLGILNEAMLMSKTGLYSDEEILDHTHKLCLNCPSEIRQPNQDPRALVALADYLLTTDN